jgi:hypothetical protein
MFGGKCISWARNIDGADVDIFSTKDVFWICTTIEQVEGAELFLSDLLKALAEEYGLPEPVDCQVTDSLTIPIVNPDGTIDVAGMQVANSPSPNFYSLITKDEAAAGYGVSESAVALEVTANQVNWVVKAENGVKKIAAMTYHLQESNEGEGLNNTVRNPLPQVMQAPPASPDLSHTDYVIMCKSSLSGWSSVINALHSKHSDYQDLTFVNKVSEKLGDLQTIKPKYVIIVIKPEDADPDFFDDVDSTMCQIDADEFEDAVWSVITGFSAADALALVNAPHATNDHTLTIANPDGSLGGAGHAGAYLAGIIADDDTQWGTSAHYISTSGANPNCSAENLWDEINNDNKDCILFLDHGAPCAWALKDSYNGFYVYGATNLCTVDGTYYYPIDNNENSFIYSEACLTSRINGKRSSSWTPWEEESDNAAGDKATSIALAWMEDSPGFYASNDSVSYGNPHIKTVLLNMMKFGYSPAEAMQISKNVYHYIIEDETSENNPSDGHVDDFLLYLEREFMGLGDTSWNVNIAGSPPNYSISYSGKTQQDQEATTRGYVYVDNDIEWRCSADLNFNEEIYREFGIAEGDMEQSPFATVYVKNVTGGGGWVSCEAYRTVIAGIFKPTTDTRSIDFVSGDPSDSGKLCDTIPMPPPGSSEADGMFKCKKNTDELVWVVRAGITDANSNGDYEWRINNGYAKSFDVYYYLPGVEQTVGGETVIDSNTREKSVTLKNQGSQAVTNVIAKVPVPSHASNFSVMPSTGITNIIKTSDGSTYCEFTLNSIAAGATKNLTLQYDIAAGPNPPTVTTNTATLVEETTTTLNGMVTNDGGEACQYHFQYDTNSGEPYAYNTGWTGSKTSGQSFSAAISGLSKGTEYYFIAQAKNSAGTGSGSELSFLTKPDAPTSFSATTASTTQINLSWVKGSGAQKTKIQRKEGSYPANKDDGTQVYFGTGTSTPDTGLSPGTTYYYRAWSYVLGSEQWSDNYAQDWATTTGAQPDVPDITISPPSFVESGPPGTSWTRTLTIGNVGNVELNYTLSDTETTGGASTGKAENQLLKPANMALEVPLEGSSIEPENTPEGGNGWQNIMTDGFEGAFPGSNWQLYGDPTWGKESYRHHTGSYSAWCAGSNYNPPSNYPNNMSSWMVYGPFSLADATDAELNFWFWNKSQGPDDYLFWGASTDGSMFYGWQWTGNSGGWVSESFDLTDVYTLDDLCGQPQVWIGFFFGSDEITTDKGAFIDDVVLRKYVGGAAEDSPWLDEEPKSGSVAPGGHDDITVTFDTTGLGSTYTADIIISSNDPDEPQVTVPVTLTVTTGVAPSVSIEPPSQTVAPGGVFNIDVWVDAAGRDLLAFDVEVQYNSNAMITSVADIEAHNLLGGLEMGPEVNEAGGVGEVTYVLASADAVAGVDASLMTITFTMEPDAEPGDYDLTITKADLVDENLAPVVVETNDGTVTVGIGRKGDFNGDGHIDIFDFVLFAAAYGSELGDDNYNPAGDFNNDGHIDIFDFVLFAGVYGT